MIKILISKLTKNDQTLFTARNHVSLLASYEAILYVDKDNPCDELTKKLQEYKIVFKEWKVDRNSVDFQLPLLIAGNGVYTEKQILSYDTYLPKILIGQQ